MEVKVIGQMDNSIDHTFESANRVYDVRGVAPTINTCGGGGLQPKILESVNELGFMDNGTGKHQSNTVYDENALCPNITTIHGGGTQQIKILSDNSIPKCLNPKGGRSGIDGLQPSVQDRVYSVCGISTSITTSFMPSILEDKTIVAMRGRNPTNPSDRTPGIELEQTLEVNQNGTSNCLTSVQKDNLVMEKVKIKQATKQGYIECEVGGVADFSYPDSETRRGRVQDNGNTCPTLTAESQDICRIEQVGQISSDNSQYGTVIGENGLCSTLQAGTHGYANSCIATQYRIRKLTPRECWRLMDFSDEDFEKAEEVNSNTQLYKQAGNSIVKNVLIAIFGQMIPGKGMCYLRDECE